MSLLDYISPGIWKLEGKCANLASQQDKESESILDSFFADEECDRAPAISFCQNCPVRLQCLRDAMENAELYGVWGGVDESERRRNLWISPTGKVGMRKTRPRCPNCRGDVELFDEDTIVCQKCDFSWNSETTAEGLLTIPLEKNGNRK